MKLNTPLPFYMHHLTLYSARNSCSWVMKRCWLHCHKFDSFIYQCIIVKWIVEIASSNVRRSHSLKALYYLVVVYLSFTMNSESSDWASKTVHICLVPQITVPSVPTKQLLSQGYVHRRTWKRLPSLRVLVCVYDMFAHYCELYKTFDTWRDVSLLPNNI